jgi:myosin heavy subunit
MSASDIQPFGSFEEEPESEMQLTTFVHPVEYQERLNGLISENFTLKMTLQGLFDRLKAFLQSINASDDVAKQILSQQEQNSTLALEIRELKDQLAKAEGDIIQLRSNPSCDQSTLVSEIASLQEQVHEAQEIQARQTAHIRILEDRLQQTRGPPFDLIDRLELFTAENSQFKQTTESLTARSAALQKADPGFPELVRDKTRQAPRGQQLERECAQAESELSELRKESASRSERIQRLERECATFRDENKSLKARMRMKPARVQTASQCEQANEDAVAATVKQVQEALKGENAALRREVQEAGQRIKALEKECAIKDRESQETTQQMKAMKSKWTQRVKDLERECAARDLETQESIRRIRELESESTHLREENTSMSTSRSREHADVASQSDLQVETILLTLQRAKVKLQASLAEKAALKWDSRNNDQRVEELNRNLNLILDRIGVADVPSALRKLSSPAGESGNGFQTLIWRSVACQNSLVAKIDNFLTEISERLRADSAQISQICGQLPVAFESLRHQIHGLRDSVIQAKSMVPCFASETHCQFTYAYQATSDSASLAVDKVAQPAEKQRRHTRPSIAGLLDAVRQECNTHTRVLHADHVELMEAIGANPPRARPVV